MFLRVIIHNHSDGSIKKRRRDKRHKRDRCSQLAPDGTPPFLGLIPLCISETKASTFIAETKASTFTWDRVPHAIEILLGKSTLDEPGSKSTQLPLGTKTQCSKFHTKRIPLRLSRSEPKSPVFTFESLTEEPFA